MKAQKFMFTLLSSFVLLCALISINSTASERELGIDGREIAMASPPPLYELELTSLSGEIFINPKYSGKINSARTLNRNELLGEKIEIETRTLTDNWKKLNIPSSLAGSFGLVISGKQGIIKITLPEGSATNPGSGSMKSISDLFIEFGTLQATFTFPEVSILEPSKFEIGIFNASDNSFINGDIIALKNNQAAVKFDNLPASVVNSDAMIRMSLRKPDGTFINSDIPAWGYNILVSETDTGVAAPITAEVFGLPDDTEIKFSFVSLSGQIINPSMQTLTVGEINKGAQVSTITTKIEGPQPITVTVRRLK